jgi:hypothetical protein
MLTLYTTPVIYLYWDSLLIWCRKLWGRSPESGKNEETGRLPAGQEA